MTQRARSWDDDRPIYRQLMEELVAGILNRTYPEGEMLPSVRQLADSHVVNPLTVARAYRELGELTETRRGIGLVVKEGVREILLKRERRKFLKDEWPALRDRIESLEIDAETLLAQPRR
jgi:GntR family transcriptional regulator